MTNENEPIRRGDALRIYSNMQLTIEEAKSAIAALPAVAASQPAYPAVKADSCQRVVVKPLVWSAWMNGFSLHTDTRLAACADAAVFFGRYSIGRKHTYLKSTKPNDRAFDDCLSSEWWVECPDRKLIGPFNGDVLAKAAAQADYEARILAAIAAQPIYDPRDAAIARLVEAGEEIKRLRSFDNDAKDASWQIHWSGALDDLIAAIAAAKEIRKNT